MSQPAIQIVGFSKDYGKTRAVDDLTLTVPEGSIFGFLGQNGAGKTTTIRTLLNLQRPTAGQLSVMGLDSVRDSVAVRRQVGYLPEEPTYYPWMTVDEILRFNRAFYPEWDGALEASLVKQLDLPRKRKLQDLSRGMQSKVGLVMALAPRPKVLILDDPTSGLDPVVRHEFLEVVIANVQNEGGAVFFSTHLLHEMERVADRLAILHKGTLRWTGSLDEVKQTVKKLRVVYDSDVPTTFPIENPLRVDRNSHSAMLTVADFDPAIEARLREHGARSVEVMHLSLEEIFMEVVKGARND